MQAITQDQMAKLVKQGKAARVTTKDLTDGTVDHGSLVFGHVDVSGEGSVYFPFEVMRTWVHRISLAPIDSTHWLKPGSWSPSTWTISDDEIYALRLPASYSVGTMEPGCMGQGSWTQWPLERAVSLPARPVAMCTVAMIGQGGGWSVTLEHEAWEIAWADVSERAHVDGSPAPEDHVVEGVYLTDGVSPFYLHAGETLKHLTEPDSTGAAVAMVIDARGSGGPIDVIVRPAIPDLGDSSPVVRSGYERMPESTHEDRTFELPDDDDSNGYPADDPEIGPTGDPIYSDEDRGTMTVHMPDDDPKVYVLAPDHVRDAIQARFEHRPVVAHLTEPNVWIYDPANHWDGPTHVTDNGNGTFSFTGWSGPETFGASTESPASLRPNEHPEGGPSYMPDGASETSFDVSRHGPYPEDPSMVECTCGAVSPVWRVDRDGVECGFAHKPGCVALASIAPEILPAPVPTFPAGIVAYASERGYSGTPIIREIFRSDLGWRVHGYMQPATVERVRELRADGVQVIAVTWTGSLHAKVDFSTRELSPMTGLCGNPASFPVTLDQESVDIEARALAAPADHFEPIGPDLPVLSVTYSTGFDDWVVGYYVPALTARGRQFITFRTAPTFEAGNEIATRYSGPIDSCPPEISYAFSERYLSGGSDNYAPTPRCAHDAPMTAHCNRCAGQDLIAP